MPYLQGISEKIARTLNQFNINVVHKPVMTVGSILKKPKEKFSKDLSTGVISKIYCKDCDKVYIGQTSRALRSRTREHKRTIFTGDRNSLLTQHFAVCCGSKISSKLMFSRFTEVLTVAMATSELRACVGRILLRGIILHWHRCSLRVLV